MNGISLQFIVVCDQAFLAAGSNNLNIIGIFSQINAAKFPFAYPHFALVVNFDAAKAGRHVLHTSVVDPAGNEIAHTDLPVTVAAGNMQVIANFENLQFAAPGEYILQVMIDGQPLGRRAIRIAPVVNRPGVKANLA